MSRLQAGALSVRQPPGRARRGRAAGPGRPRRRPAARSSSTCPTTCREVLADPGLLERVIANLVGNALRLQPAGRRRRCVTGSSLGDRVELRVIDRGPGHPAEPSWTGCSRRSSGSATPTTPPASGSGLALSRGLTEAMGGTLDPGGHPRRRADHGGVAAAPPPASRPTRRTRPAPSARPRPAASSREIDVTRVLVVDDEPQILRALAINLRARRYEVHTAATGAERARDGGRAPAGPRHPRPRACPTSTASR